MKKQLHFLLTLSILSFISCNEDPQTDYYDHSFFTKNYICCYVYPVESLCLQCEPSSSPEYTMYGDGIYLYVSGQECTADNNKERYDSLSASFGDISFDKSDHYGKRNYRQLSCIAETIRKIVVTSDKDFDAIHPAGSSLSDIVYFSSATAYPFIANGYKPWNEDSGRYDGGYTLVHAMLNELDGSAMQLLSTEWMYIDFPVKPLPGEYLITVQIEMEDGRSVEAKIKKTFR